MMPSAIAVIGAGPAGLMAAEHLAAAGHAVTIYDRMPSPGRKFLMAGRGGLNLTHSEPIERFLPRYGEAEPRLRPIVEAFPPTAVRDWTEGLGEPTFVGSSGRIFPKSLKASPLLRAWLRRLDDLGVRIALRHDWQGLSEDGRLIFGVPGGKAETVSADATLLALGGASWPRLGSNGAWVPILAAQGIAIEPLEPANGGFRTAWSDQFAERFAGEPLKTVAMSAGSASVRGEALVTRYGLEGGAIYALSTELRRAIAQGGTATVTVDLLPNLGLSEIARRIGRQKPSLSLSNALRKAAGLTPVAINLLRETSPGPLPRDPDTLAAMLKAVPVTLVAPAGIERAISTAGGVAWDGIDERMMLKRLPGIFVAGEMIDWEAPTGGYLLQASFASGVAAARGMIDWLADQNVSQAQ